MSKSPSIFNSDKLDWMNGQYIRSASSEELADALLDFWHRYPPKEIPDLPDKETLLPIVPLIQERLKTLRDAAPRISFFFEPTVDYETDELVQKAMDLPGTKSALERSLAVLEELNSFDSDSIERVLRPLADDLGIKTGQLLGSLRVATTGLKVAPPLFETMEVLGPRAFAGGGPRGGRAALALGLQHLDVVPERNGLDAQPDGLGDVPVRIGVTRQDGVNAGTRGICAPQPLVDVHRLGIVLDSTGYLAKGRPGEPSVVVGHGVPGVYRQRLVVV